MEEMIFGNIVDTDGLDNPPDHNTEEAASELFADENKTADTSGENSDEKKSAASKSVDDDLDMLRSEFSELSDIVGISDLPNPTRYAALRDLGLSPEEAYLATCRPTPGTRSHLTSSVPRVASTPVERMSRTALLEARELFSDMTDTEIQRLYKKVTTN